MNTAGQLPTNDKFVRCVMLVLLIFEFNFLSKLVFEYGLKDGFSNKP